ncbi:MAG: 2-C-methyl-D-erythritol 4-phosphate cytidylyltransferase [Eubacteriales bacterium]
MNEKNVAIVLAGGQGKRMNSRENKQYMLLEDMPVLYYSLKIIQDSFMDEIILVVPAGQAKYCHQEFVQRYGISKIGNIVEGGKERYHSVYAGIMASNTCDNIYIHDGARPFLKVEHLEKLRVEVAEHRACVLAVPVKDTVKIANEEGFITHTPVRTSVWAMQTPQVFAYSLIKQAYEELIAKEEHVLDQGIQITDDAMVVETFMKRPIKLVEGAYTNIKITTPEDLLIATSFLKG